ncbi:hypothetical protein LXL04_006523 [Taraxacum kok-saghyz]
MDVEIDHYIFLGLPSGEEGSKLSEKEITKAYRLKALELHPDKRPNDPNAPANFQKLQTSYQILKDEKARKLFDDLLRVKQQKIQRQSQQDSKRRRMMSDLEERERSAFYQDPNAKARNEEESIARKLKEEISRIRKMHSNKTGFNENEESSRKNEKSNFRNTGMYTDKETDTNTDKERTLKVSWEKGGLEYSAERLRGLFETFGEVKDVMIRKKKGSAFVIMATKEAAIAATGTVCGDLSNPLLVIPLQPAVTNSFPTAREPVKSSDGIRLNENLVGSRYQAYEDSVLQKLQKVSDLMLNE